MANLDMSLDDMIKMKNKNYKNNAVAVLLPPYSGHGPSRRFSNRTVHFHTERNEGRGRVMAWLQGSKKPTRGRKGGQGSLNKVSAQDLDADLEKYYVKAMQTN